nr:MAG: RNA-dependent RNA polymerase [Sanya tombus-like virus 6]
MAGLGTGVDYGVHSNCLQNMIRGITERVLYVPSGEGLAKPPQPKDGVFGRLSHIRERLVRKACRTPVIPLDDFPAYYDGRKRRVYQNAVDSLKTRGLTVRDATIDAFLKAEKVNFTAKVDPAPRLIQPCTPRYNTELGRYLKLFEKELLARAFTRVFGYRVVVKGLNAQETADVIVDHWKRYRNPVAVGLDASRFDQHVSADALKWEHSVYNAVFRDPKLKQLLSWQVVNRCIARVEGMKLEYEASCRMSGHPNTGLGNCLIMSSIVLGFLEEYDVDARLVNNGDDCVLILDKSELSKLNRIMRWALDFGITLKREEPVYEVEHIEFCQAHPVLCANGWRMVRDPRVAMSKDCVSLQDWSTETGIRYWAQAIGTCGLALTRGVPVWQAWYEQLVTLGVQAPEGVSERVWDCGMGMMAKGVVGCDVSQEARYSFWKAFGIPPDVQEALEEEYRRPLELVPFTPTVYPAEIPTIDSQNPLTTWLRESKHDG